MSTDLPYYGRCLCGAVRFAFDEPVGGSAHCHCSMCREAHGAAYVTWIVTYEKSFEITTGEDRLKWYDSSEEAQRGFCADCGSTLFFRSSLCPGEVHVTRANLETDTPVEAAYHCFWDEHVPWIEVSDDLPKLTVDGPELERYRQRKGYEPPDGSG